MSKLQIDIFLYFKEISKYKLLTKEEEVSLSLRSLSGDIEARNKLITSNLRLVILIAKKYIGKGVLFEDLISEGNIGLFNAIRKFNPSAGFKFSTYATLWITQKILRAIESSGRIRVPSYMQFIRKRIEKIKNILSARGDHNLAIKPMIPYAIGKGCKITHSTINAIIQANSVHTVVSTDNIIHEPSEGNTTLKNIMSSECIHEVAKLINNLPERTQKIIKMRYGIGYHQSMTLKEISKEIKPELTRERIRQILYSTINEIRRKVEVIGIDDWEDN